MSTLQVPHRARKSQKRLKASSRLAIPAERVREMLREIAFVLHATRVVRRMGEGVGVKEEW